MRRHQVMNRVVVAGLLATWFSVNDMYADGRYRVLAQQESQVETEALAASGVAELTDAGNRLQLPGMTVTGTAEQLRELPGSGQKIELQEIRQQSYGDINRVLSKVPGLYLRAEDGFGLFPNISIRGADPGRSSKATMLEDGVLTAPAPYSAPAAYYSPTVARMSGLEVLKGSSQIRYGPHTTGGVINYLSTSIPNHRAAYLRTLYGKENEFRTHLYFGDLVNLPAGGRIGYLIEGFYRRTDGFKRLDTGGDTGFRNVEPMVKLAWEPDTDIYQHFELRVGYTDLSADETYLGLSESDFQKNPYRRYSASQFDNISLEHLRSYLRHYVLLNEAWDTETTAYYNRTDRNWYKLHELQNVGRVPDFTAPAVPIGMSSALAAGGAALDALRGEEASILVVRANNREYYLWGIENVTNYRFAGEGVNHTLTMGARYHYDQALRFQWEDRYAQQADGSISDFRRGAPGTQDNRLEETAAVALSLQDKMEFGRVTVTAGVRYENLQHKLDDRRPGREQQLSGDMHLLGGGLGFNHAMDSEWNLFGGVHRGFSPPQPGAALVHDVREETSIASELGLRYHNEPQLLIAELVGFYTTFDDLIVRETIGVGTPGDDNIGEARSYGIELSLRVDPGTARDWGVKTPTYLSYTFTRAELTSETPSAHPESIFSGARKGSRIPYVPEHGLSFGTGVQVGRFGIHGQWAYVDAMFTTASNTMQQLDIQGHPDARFGKTDSFLIMDISADYNLSSTTKLFAGGQNVLDNDYLASRHPHGPRPGSPLFVYAGMELQF